MKHENEKIIFWKAVLAASFLHFGIILVLILADLSQANEPVTILATMDFSSYDPEGGAPSQSAEEEIVSEEPVETVPEPEPEPEPESVLPDLIQSTAQKATPLPEPPPVKTEPKVKPRPKPKIVPTVPGPTSSPSQGQGIGGTGQGNPNLLSAYKSQITKKLNRLKKYPALAKTQKMSGVVTVHFTIGANGTISAKRLVKSSGYTILDEEAMALLNRSSPFPGIPKELGLPSLSLNVPISFSIK